MVRFEVPLSSNATFLIEWFTRMDTMKRSFLPLVVLLSAISAPLFASPQAQSAGGQSGPQSPSTPQQNAVTIDHAKDTSGANPEVSKGSAPADSTYVDSTVRFPETVSPGSTLNIPGKFPGNQTPVVKIHSVGANLSTDPGTEPDTTKKSSDSQIDVKLPDKLPPGRYYLTLDFANLKGVVVPSEVRVSGNGVTLDAAHPTTAYPDGTGGFNFEVIGQGFSSTPKDNNVWIKGQGLIIKSWATNKQGCETKGADEKPCLWYDSSQPDKLHVVGYAGEAYQGPLSFKVQVGGAQSTSEKNLILARLSPAGIRFWSILLFVIFAYIIYRLVARGVRDYTIDGEHYSAFYSFFLDRTTDTYSLSKFQLLLFSATFIFGYVYVFLCSWLVQWNFILPDVPASFSGILGMSVGTTVVAAGATATRGSKGSGGIRPSVADFITTGGQVVPERFQYFVWTLVACFGFVALLLSQDPALISGFPVIPQGLLYIMGVSAGGYLGGKITRSAGPVIRNIAWDAPRNQLIVQGENLSDQGDYFIDGKKLPIVPNATNKLITSTPQQDASERTFSSELKIAIADPEIKTNLQTGDHVFRVMNKDGQFADMRFTADPPRIDSVTADPPPAPPLPVPEGNDSSRMVPATTENKVVKVTGAGFRTGTVARWTATGEKEPVEIKAVQVQDDKNLKLTLVPGAAGPATLFIMTPNGFSAVATVMVVKPAGQS